MGMATGMPSETLHLLLSGEVIATAEMSSFSARGLNVIVIPDE
jgi:hypothetical protein